jgi:chromosome segregation ATPase
MGRLDDIVARLSRIESKLGGSPGEVEHHAGHSERPQVPAEVRQQFEKRMKEARARMEEGRERMEQARRKFHEMEERIRTLEAEVEKLKSSQK